MDQYYLLILLCMFNPVVTSLRGLQQASELKKVQKKLGCARTSLGSLSESVAVFDSERLKPIIESLGEKPESIGSDKRLKDLQQTLTLVDGSIVEAMPRIAMESFRDAQAGSGKKMKWTLHTHFEVDRSVPTKINVTPTTGGEHDERVVMDRMIESDRTYVMDRGYAKFELFNRIVDAGSRYVCRIRDNRVLLLLKRSRTHRRGDQEQVRPVRAAMASCALRQICWTRLQRSSRYSITTTGPLRFPLGFLSICWAAAIC